MFENTGFCVFCTKLRLLHVRFVQQPLTFQRHLQHLTADPIVREMDWRAYVRQKSGTSGIRSARRDPHVLEHLQEVLAAREGNSRFLDITIGYLPEEKPRAYNDPEPSYALITLVPGDEEELQALQRNMKSSGNFKDVSIDGMDLDPDGFRTIQLSARRAA